VNKERRLGRGLEALLGRPLTSPSEAADGSPIAADPPRDGIVHVHVYEIENNPFQPRRDFDDNAIGELSESLIEHGMLQPLVVRRHGERYQLIAGERRLRAAIKAGWQRVPAQVHEADDRQMCEIAIVENLQRKDLNALEKAISFQQYLERYGVTQEELAGRLKIDRSTVANLIRLLELPETIQQSIRSGQLSQGHARALLPLGDEHEQVAFAKRIQAESLSVRTVEELVQETIHRDDHEPLAVIGVGPRDKKPRRALPHAAALEQELRSALGTKVDLKSKAGGRGQIVIHFASHEEFERLRAHLAGRTHKSKVG
jgi:ParB family chromosome partitioning protein